MRWQRAPSFRCRNAGLALQPCFFCVTACRRNKVQDLFVIVHGTLFFFSSAARDHLIYLLRGKRTLGNDLAWSLWPCRRGLLIGLAVVSRSSLTYLQGLRVQLLLRERGEEMTFTQLSREQQETLTVPSS